MRNPFNPDHDHSEDLYPELHQAVLHLRLHWMKMEGDEKKRASDALDNLINACPNYECAECAAICCPHHDEMHLHHDGCPSCAQDDSIPHALDCKIVKEYLSGRIIPPSEAPQCDCFKSNSTSK